MAPIETVKEEAELTRAQDGRGVVKRTSLQAACIKRKFELDLDTLDCAICMEPLRPPVFQCYNGHIACLACCLKLSRKCHSCSKPTGKIRNLAVEKVIESLRVSCNHVAHGCNHIPRFTMKEEHERHCDFRPLTCPYPGCKHSIPRDGLRSHLTRVHKMRTVLSDPIEEDDLRIKATFNVHPLEPFIMLERPFFLLHHEKTNRGDFFFITSLYEHNKRYKLKVETSNKLDKYVMRTVTEDIADESNWRRNFILIPKQSGAAMNCLFKIGVSIFSSHA